MARGGARNRSGPQPVEGSRTSDRKGIVLTALSPAGYNGDVPEFPLGPSVTDSLTSARELVIWNQAWTTPQACAWSLEAWRWPIVGEYCRLKAIVEMSPAASAALVGQLHRYRDQIGLTPAGLKENGWKIADPAPPAVTAPTSDEGGDADDPRNRLSVVRDGTGG